MANYASKGLSVGKGLTIKKMNVKTSMVIFGFLFLFSINCWAQQDGLNDSIISQGDDYKRIERKEKVSLIIHGKDETKFQKALVNLVIKNVSILQYGAAGKLSMVEEALVHEKCRTEREAGEILAPFMAQALFTMPGEKMKSIIKSIDDELKVIRKLRTPVEIEADELGL